MTNTGTVNQNDMYPLYRTISKEGIFMKYSYEFKKECVQLYRLGKWADTPERIRDKQFHDMIIIQSRLENLHGPEVLKRNSNRVWITDEKLELIFKIMAGKSVSSIAINAGISRGQLYTLFNKVQHSQANRHIFKI